MIFKSNINLLRKVYHFLTIPSTMNGSNVILGKDNKERLNRALEYLSKAIDELQEID